MSGKRIYFVNSFVEQNIKYDAIKQYIDNVIGSTDWRAFNNGLYQMPAELDEFMTEDFRHGMAAEQYLEMMSDGIYVNPLIAGLATDAHVWGTIFAGIAGNFEIIDFIEIPYFLFKDSVPEERLVSQEVFDESTSNIKQLTEVLNEYVPIERVLH